MDDDQGNTLHAPAEGLRPVKPPSPRLTPRAGQWMGAPFPPPQRVTESCNKLGEDAYRALSRHRRETWSPDMASQSPAAFATSIMNAADMWRTVFHAEAMECVRAMAAVVEGGSVKNRPEDFRKAELKASVHLQQHVKQMTRLNEALNQFLSDSRASGNLTSFTDSLAQLSRLNSHVDEQKSRWANLDWRLDRLQEDVVEVKKIMLEKHSEYSTILTDTANVVNEGTSSLSTKLEEANQRQTAVIEELAQHLKADAAENLEAARTHVEVALSKPNPLSASLEEIQKRMTSWEELAKKENSDLQTQVGELQSTLTETQGQSATWQAAAEQARSELTALEERAHTLIEQLDETRGDLEVVASKTLGNSLLRLKQVEARGNVKMNRDTGALAVLRPVDFTPCKPADGTPHPQFVDAEAASTVLEDVAAVMQLIDVPADVEVHLKELRNAPPAFCDELGQNSASVVQATLEEKGVSTERLRAKGLVGKSGSNTNCISIRFQSEIFSAAEASKPSSAGRPRTKSPAPTNKGRGRGAR